MSTTASSASKLTTSPNSLAASQPPGRSAPMRQPHSSPLRPGLKFQPAPPVTADDAAFSLQRVVLLDKTPPSLLNQFGWTKDNVRYTR